MKLLIALLLTVAVAKFGHALEYVEIFRDDFNDQSINYTKWNVAPGPGNHNEEMQYYTDDNVWEDHDFLFLRSQRQAHGDRWFTSGRVTSLSKFSFMYGEVEWRAKLPAGKGIWPAFWLLPDTLSWPPEIDVMEFRGDKTWMYSMASHYYGPWPHVVYDWGAAYGPDLTANFHTYKAIWDPNQIIFLFDGREVHRITEWHKIPHEPMYLIMNVAVGGNYPGPPDWSTPFPTHLVIDYVSVHRWQ